MLFIYLYFRTFSIELTLDWTRQREKWHQKLLLKCIHNCIYGHPFARWCLPSVNHSMDNSLKLNNKQTYTDTELCSSFPNYFTFWIVHDLEHDMSESGTSWAGRIIFHMPVTFLLVSCLVTHSFNNLVAKF